MAEQGGIAVLDCLSRLDECRALGKPQSEKGASSARKLSKDDMKVDWSRFSAGYVWRMWLAFGADTWSTIVIDDIEKKVKLEVIESVSVCRSTKATAGSVRLNGNTLAISCHDGEVFLSVLKIEGRNAIKAIEFDRGYLAKGKAVHFK
jgi:methionyl-tRNA formyltransferase